MVFLQPWLLPFPVVQAHKRILWVSKTWRCISSTVKNWITCTPWNAASFLPKPIRCLVTYHTRENKLESKNLKVLHNKHPCANVWLMNIRRAHPAVLSRYTEKTETKGLLILWFTFNDYITMTDGQTCINDNNVCFPCVQMNARLSRPCLKHLCAGAYYIPIVTQRSLRLFVCTQLWK